MDVRARLRTAARHLLDGRQPRTIHERFPAYEIGRGTYGAPRVLAWDEGTTLRIGAFCSIASGVEILLGGNHRVDWVSTFPFNKRWPEAKNISGHPTSRGDVIIGNDVWIGRSAMLTSGISIGDGAVIGGGAVVSRDVAPYAIVAGNPAQVVRMRFDEETVERLLAVRWWDWPDEVIAAHLPLILDSDIGRFLDAAERGESLLDD